MKAFVNPFVKDGCMLPIASINRHPVQNQTAHDVFNPALFLHQIRQEAKFLQLQEGISDDDLWTVFDQALTSPNPMIRETAKTIAESFAKPLVDVIKALVQPTPSIRRKRPEWQNEHWTYWQHVKRIVFVGGFLSQPMADVFQAWFDQHLTGVRCTFEPQSEGKALAGLRTQSPGYEALLFDAGQTRIKRGRLKADGTMERYASVAARFLSDPSDPDRGAKTLHDYLMHVISETIDDSGFTGNTILLALSNYVHHQALNPSSSGYGMLSRKGTKYGDLLASDLSLMMRRKLNVRLFHDTTATALCYKGKHVDVVISLGTAFGIAFVEAIHP